MQIQVFTDGGSRGNPGQAAIGAVISFQNSVVGQKQEKIIKIGKRIGVATNNEAEYTAVVEALQNLKLQIANLKSPVEKIQFFIDSNLVVNQLNGLFKVKNERMRMFLLQIRQLEAEIKIPVFYTHVPREKNKEADFLVNQALDEG